MFLVLQVKLPLFNIDDFLFAFRWWDSLVCMKTSIIWKNTIYEELHFEELTKRVNFSRTPFHDDVYISC